MRIMSYELSELSNTRLKRRENLSTIFYSGLSEKKHHFKMFRSVLNPIKNSFKLSAFNGYCTKEPLQQRIKFGRNRGKQN